jgi:hypothetical protein
MASQRPKLAQMQVIEKINFELIFRGLDISGHEQDLP